MIEEPNAPHRRTMGIMETEVVVDEGDTAGIAVVDAMEVVIAVADHTVADATSVNDTAFQPATLRKQ